MNLAAVVLVAFAAHRLARAVAVDDISAPFRQWVADRAYHRVDPAPMPDGARDVDDARMIDPDWSPGYSVGKSRPWRWVYGLVSCPHCCGFWISLALWWAWVGYDSTRVWWVSAVAVAGAQSVLAARGTDG